MDSVHEEVSIKLEFVSLAELRTFQRRFPLSLVVRRGETLQCKLQKTLQTDSTVECLVLKQNVKPIVVPIVLSLF